MSGAMDMTGEPEQPTKAYAPYVDFCSASLAAFGTLLAYLEKQKTGKGQRVQTSLLQTALTTTNSLLIEQEILNINRVASLNRAQTSGPSDTFKTKDGWILVQTVGGPLFERWVNLMGEKDWLEDKRFKDDLSRGENGHLISERMVINIQIKSIEEIELKISPKNSRVISNIYSYFPNGLKTNIKDGSKVKTEIIANNIANPVKIPKQIVGMNFDKTKIEKPKTIVIEVFRIATPTVE